MPPYLTGQRELSPGLPNYYSPGGEDEAVICANDLILPWENTPEAVAWLRAETRKMKK